jgi:NAD(P)H-hydrate epimerase
MSIKYVTVAEMQAIEREANEAGFNYDYMMENAGRNLAEAILDEYGYLEGGGSLGLVGSGNNGGDTLVALTYLAQEGWKATAVVVRPRPLDDPLLVRLRLAGGEIVLMDKSPDMDHLKRLIGENEIFLDGVLGTGIRLPLKGELSQLLSTVRDHVGKMGKPPVIVAVDCPSGVDCDSGEAAPDCIPADLTVTMAAIKQGLYKFPAFNLVGELRLVGIGLPENGESMEAWKAVKSFIPDADWVNQTLPHRPLDSHKGTFGAAMVIAGSENYTGAALLAGQAAYRIGAGLVTLALPAPLHAALAGHFPEATWLLLPHKNGVIADIAWEDVVNNLERVTSLLIGPGFGLEETTGRFLSQLITHTCDLPPLVVDADGLKLLKRVPGWSDHLPKPAVLTPHPGEMSVLTDLPVAEIQQNRLDVARRFSSQWGHVIVLKGAFTAIAAPDGQAAVIPVATPALARAGTGDVLAGLIVGLRAQGLAAFPAAVAGAWIHAYAGIQATQILGNPASVLAGDILRAVIQVVSNLQ